MPASVSSISRKKRRKKKRLGKDGICKTTTICHAGGAAHADNEEIEVGTTSMECAKSREGEESPEKKIKDEADISSDRQDESEVFIGAFDSPIEAKKKKSSKKAKKKQKQKSSNVIDDIFGF